MSVRDDARKDWEQGIKYKDIANKYGVSENTVKSWASRYWKNESEQVATKKKKLQPSLDKLQPCEESSKRVVKAMADAADENTELTEKQKEFCVRFMQNRNATQAYLKVYECAYETAGVNGSRLLGNAKIQKELRRLREIKNSALGSLCGDDVIELHMRIAFADITDFIDFQSRKVPVHDREGKVICFTDPQTGEQIPITKVETDLLLKDSATVDGTLLTEVSEDRIGVKIKLADKMKSLQFLERYFELNPNDRHKRDFDNAKIEIEKERLAMIREKDEIEIEDTAETDGAIYGEESISQKENSTV